MLKTTLLKRVRAFAHVDDDLRFHGYDASSATTARPTTSLSASEQRLAEMLFFSLWPGGGGHASYDAGLTHLRAERALRSELRAVVDLSFEAARHQSIEARRISSRDVPLQVHARYQREEVLGRAWATPTSTASRPA